MWAMTALPLFGWAVTLWLIFTHERVTCFNYHAVLAWLDSHELHHEDDDGAEAGGAAHQGGHGLRIRGRLRHIRAVAQNMRDRQRAAMAASPDGETCGERLWRRAKGFFNCCECICFRKCIHHQTTAPAQNVFTLP